MVKKSENAIENLFHYLNSNVTSLNNSKFFAGLMIIVLNISSRFVNLKLSKTMESYLKYTFSRDILVFAISWMGTRDIYVAFIITSIFILCADYLLNENSSLCCLPEHFTDYHVSLLDNNDLVTDDDIKKAKEVLVKAEKQKKAANNKDDEEESSGLFQDTQKPKQYQAFASV